MNQFFLSLLSLPIFLSAIEFQGHRGARGILPENSLPGFEAAIVEDVKVIEMDLLLTKDGEIVIFHDFYVNSKLCCYMDGAPIEKTALIKDLTLAELRHIDCGSLPNPAFPRQKIVPKISIPTLKELFGLIRGSSHPNAKYIKLNLEVKADPCSPHCIPHPDEIANKVVDTVKQAGFTHQVYYSSFDFGILHKIRQLDAEATIGLLFESETLIHAGIDPRSWMAYVLSVASSLRASIISPDYVLLTSHHVKEAHEAGLRVIPWTVNDPLICRDLIEMGVDGLITDYPMEMNLTFNKEQK